MVLPDRLTSTGISSKYSNAINHALQDYVDWCQIRGEAHHQSKVHSFKDTISQAKLLSIHGKDYHDKLRLAELTFFAHLLDDKLDSGGIVGVRVDSYDDFQVSATNDVSSVSERMMDFGLDHRERAGIRKTIMKVAHGAAIQSSSNSSDQKLRAQKFQLAVASGLSNKGFQSRVMNLHPAVFYLTTHSSIDAWVSIGSRTDTSDISAALDLFFTPMIYYHDAKVESRHVGEGFPLAYGRRLTSGGIVRDKHFFEMMSIFDDHFRELSHGKNPLLFEQMLAAYDSFRPHLPSSLVSKYDDSLKFIRG
ncbi:MAG: hypothetical protein AABW73_05040 [Nanoarchaeota archaeon]